MQNDDPLFYGRRLHARLSVRRNKHLIENKPFGVILDLNQVVVVEGWAEIPERVARNYEAVRHTGTAALGRADPARKQNKSRTLNVLSNHRSDYTHWAAEEGRKLPSPLQ